VAGHIEEDQTAFVGGVQQEGYAFQQPVLLSLTYADADVAGAA